jgi:hypothetical protein
MEIEAIKSAEITRVLLIELRIGHRFGYENRSLKAFPRSFFGQPFYPENNKTLSRMFKSLFIPAWV